MKALYRIHQWAGAAAGLLFALLGITGSLLVFRDEVERRQSGVRLEWEAGLPRAPLQQALQEAKRRHPGARVLIVNRKEPVEVVLWENNRSLLLAFDPITGDELGPLRRPDSWLGPVSRLHFSLAMTRGGREVLGATAALMVAMSLSGAWLFWRRRASLHARLGVVLAAPLLLFGVSGFMFVFARPAGPTPPVYQPSAREWKTLDEITARAEKALPGGRTSYLSFPFARGSALSVRVRLPGDLRANGAHDVHLNPETGEVLRVDRLQLGPWQRWLYMQLAALHFGEFGGVAVKCVWVVLGLGPAALWISGLAHWWSRRRAAVPTPPPPRNRPR